MGMTYLDLKPYFNLKMVYPDNTTFVPGECIGIHNLIVEERNYSFGETKKTDVRRYSRKMTREII